MIQTAEPIHSRSDDPRRTVLPLTVVWILPAAMFIVLLAGNVINWVEARKLGRELALNRSANTAEEVGLRIELYLRERVNSLVLLSKLWREDSEPGPTDHFLKHAKRIIAQSPGFDAILYMEGDSWVMVASPLRHHSELIGVDLTVRPGHAEFLEKVRDSLFQPFIAPVTRLSGDRGLVMWLPIMRDEGFAASIPAIVSGTLHLGEVINLAITPSNQNDFWIKVEVDGSEVFNTSTVLPSAENPDFSLRGISRLPILEKDWRISAWPRDESMLAQLAGNDMRRLGFQVFVSAIASALLAWALTMLNRVHLLLKDVTEKNRLERRLRQVQKMESIGTLAGGIAHDFNNILGSILGYTQMSMIAAEEGGKLKRRLGEVFKAATLAKELVRQILTFSRQSEQEFRPMDISPIARETLKMIRASIPATIGIEWNISPRAGHVMGDPIQIQQVIMNLCANAAHSMSDRGGTLSVTLESVDGRPGRGKESTINRSGPWLRLAVSDTGTGIDPGIMDRIFEPYFTTKEVGEGTGMGLSVVHGIVRNHGGAIEVNSHPDRGTTVSVFLPVITGPVKAVKAGTEVLQTGKESILLVDDDRSLLAIGGEMLEYLGYRVEMAIDGREALEKFRSDPRAFDLIITDQTMPRLTGLDLVREVMDIRPDIPVVMTTGYGKNLDLDRLLELGIKALLVKPLALEEISVAVRKALGPESFKR